MLGLVIPEHRASALNTAGCGQTKQTKRPRIFTSTLPNTKPFIQKAICTPMLIAVLDVTVRT